MRDPKRIDEFCEALRQKWHEVPDWRFGQLMSNFIGAVLYQQKRDIFYIEDDELIELLKKYMDSQN